MFIAGGIFGLCGTYFLSKTPEPQSFHANERIQHRENTPTTKGPKVFIYLPKSIIAAATLKF